MAPPFVIACYALFFITVLLLLLWRYISVNNLCMQLDASRKEWERTEDALKKSEQRFRKFVESVTDYVYTVEVKNGKAAKIIHSPDCLAVTGYRAEEYDADRLLYSNIIHEDDRPDVTRHHEIIISSGVCKSFGYRIIHKDGSVRWMINTPVAHYSETGDLASYDNFIKDITKEKELEGKLIQSEKMASLGVLSAGIAHELKNPLSIILRGIELLEVSDTQHNRSTALSLMKDAVFRADKITRDLLSFSKNSPLKTESVEFKVVLDETISIINPTLQMDRIKPRFSIPSSLPKVMIAASELKQVLINLINNAYEAMDKDGNIAITAEEGTGEEGKNIVRITVADNGTGIPEEDIENIFDPFYSTKKQSGGTGLGLSVVKGIIEKHEGVIKVESEVGKGTSIVVELPCELTKGKEVYQ